MQHNERHCIADNDNVAFGFGNHIVINSIQVYSIAELLELLLP